MNLKRLSTEIPLNSVPLTLREAMITTIELGFHYAWIDSICIIQDSKEDWNYESSHMGQYYSMAACNIAATVGESCDSGLFRSRHRFASQACIVQSQQKNTSVGSAIQVDDSTSQFIRTTKQSRLETRGWVTQELLLAPRILYFGEDQVFFECSQFRAAESDPGHHLIPSPSDGAGGRLPNRSNKHNDVVVPITPKLDALKWTTVVTQYSSCDLSKRVEDKLVAIMGLAQICGPSQGYLAGLWRNDLAQGLLWRPFGANRFAEYVAPTWSWASMDGHVMYEDFSDELEAKTEVILKSLFSLVSAQTVPFDPNDHNHFGRLTGGFLQLRVCAFRVARTHATGFDLNITLQHPKRGTFILRWQPDDLPSYYLADPKPDFVHAPIAQTAPDSLKGLLLMPTGQARGEYRRAGMFAFEAEEDSEGDSDAEADDKFEGKRATAGIKDIESILGASLRRLGDSEYESGTGEERFGLEECVITII